MNTKIKAINPNVKSMRLSIPYDGIIEIDANGEALVSQKAAEALVQGTHDWEYAEKVNSKSEKETDESNAEKSEDEQVVAGIKKMKIEEMIEMAKAAGYPEKEWERFSKKEKLMGAYLIKKYNEAKLNEETDESNAE